MTGYLLDTNVASVLAPGRSEAAPRFEEVLGWLKDRGPTMYLSVMTVLEIESGVQRLALRGSARQGPELSKWLLGLIDTFGKRVLPVDNTVAMAAGRLEALALATGGHPGLADLIIGATGQVHDLTVLTRNPRHFEPLGVQVADPFQPETLGRSRR